MAHPVGTLMRAGAIAWLVGAMTLDASAASQALRVAPIAYTERTLANGLQVIAVPSRGSPTAAVQVWYRVGSKDDPAGRSGFAHLFEHLMFKGTRFLKSEQFDRLTEDVGGSNNAFTSNDMTAYQSIVPSNHLEVLLWAEAERMSNLDVNQANFVSERAVVEEEYRQRILASPYGRFSNAIAPAAYQVHPYKRTSIGRIDDLEAATLQDVVTFHSTYYRPDNATLVIAGDFDAQQLDAWVDKYFGALPRPATAVPRVSDDEPAWTSDRRVAVTGPRVPLDAIALVWLGPNSASADVPALQVAAALLSAGESSRLNQALVYREQIASDVGFDVDVRAGPGLLTATAIAASGKSLDELSRSLQVQLDRLANQPVSAAELAKIKTQVLTGALLLRQTPEGLASAVADAAVLAGNPAKVNSDLQALQAVTAQDVQRVVRRYVTSAHRVTVTYSQEHPAGGATK